jgi:YD repeat-containing protein
LTPRSPLRGPTSDPSTLVRNTDGTRTRTYPDGTVLQFNTSGKETSETDRNGNTTAYAYVTSGAAAGALAAISDPIGLVTTLAYDSSGHLNTINT